MACEAACDLIQPRLMAMLIDGGVQKMDMQYVVRMGLTMLGVTGVGAVFACVRNITSSNASLRFAADLRLDLYTKIQSLSVSDAERYDGGSLITRMTNDVTLISNFVNSMMRIFFKAPVVCVGSIILAASINPRSVPIVLGIVIVSFGAMAFSLHLSHPMFGKVQVAMDKLNTAVREYLMGIRLVRAFGRQGFEGERFQEANERLSSAMRQATRVLGVFSPVTNLACNVGIAVIILFGSRWVSAGQMQVGEIMAFVTYMGQIMFSLSAIGGILNSFARTKASYSRVTEILELPGAEPVSGEYGKVPKNNSAAPLLRFDNVSFRYPLATGEMALQNISFSLEPGQTLGVIGSTGSGKSTLAALLLRFYEISEGGLYFNGTEINKIPPRALRDRIGFAPQAPTLFSGTLRENLQWGDAAADEECLVNSAKAAQAMEFIGESASGLDTVLGQGGLGLSGGQRQRLSIARALVKKPDLLILDDCTSALDVLTESKVRKEIARLGVSCIIISQRVGAVMQADKILVLENGRMEGLGSHSQLMEACDSYRGIYRSQMGREAV